MKNKPIYIVSEKGFYTDGPGLIIGYSYSQEKAKRFVKKSYPRVKFYDRGDMSETWSDEETQTLYIVEKYEIPFIK